MAWAAVIGTVGGALLSKGGGGSQASSTNTKEPWAPAQPYILDNLKREAGLQDYYNKNPFNVMQKTGYQNQASDLDNFRSNIAPGLLNFANQGMNSQYQRQRGGAPGSGAGYGGAMQPGGMRSTGLLGPFSAAPSQRYGQIDWAAMNPQNNMPAMPPAAQPAPVDPYQQYLDEQRRQSENFGGGE
jgi:hypothetical protein